jgi:hypothetical protein
MILVHTLAIQRRQLSRAIHTQPAATGTDIHTPSSTTSALSPTGALPSRTADPAPTRPADPAHEHLKTFLRWSSEVDRQQSLVQCAFDGALAPHHLAADLPLTWSRCVASPAMPMRARVALTAETPRFAWPLDLQDGPNALAHLCGFARSVLIEVAAKVGLRDWKGAQLPP